MKLLIVDGSNIVMRASFGGKIDPAQSTPTAMGMIDRAYRDLEATHLVIVFDCPDFPTWRKKLYPEYKAHRETDTRPWIDAALRDWDRSKQWIEVAAGFEADDIIATIAEHAKQMCEVLVLSSDSDLFQISCPEVCVCRPVNGGGVSAMTEDMICERYGIGYPELIVDFKALTGEDGDNVPGVEGIGAVKAAQLLKAYGTLEDVIKAGQSKSCKGSTKVAEAAETARLAHRLISLDKAAPVVNLLLKLFCLSENFKLAQDQYPMTLPEQREYIYTFQERLGILGADRNPTDDQIIIAKLDAQAVIEKMRL